MKSSATDIVIQEFEAATKETFEYHSPDDVEFESIGVEVASDYLNSQVDPDAEMFSSSIGLDGDELSSSIALLGAADTIQAACRVNIDSPRDWIGELANLLMGALKTKLTEYRVESRLGLPVSVRGKQLDFITTDAIERVAQCVRTPKGIIIVVLHFAVKRGVEWERAAEKQATDDVCLF